MTNQSMTTTAIGKILSWGVSSFAENAAELEFVIGTENGPLDLKTEENTDPGVFSAIAALLATAYAREETVCVTFFEDTRFVNFVGLPAQAWAGVPA